MQNDKLFHRLFQLVPQLVFELVGEAPETTEQYEAYRSEEIKEKAYRLDGILLPKSLLIPICFIEIQARLDPWFYHRLFSEIFLYLHQHKCKGSWRAIVIFWDKSSEPDREDHFTPFFASNRIKIVYLKPALKNAPRTLWMNLLRLIVATEKQAPPLAREIGHQIAVPKEPEDEYIVQLIIGILLNKFQNLTRDKAMDLLDLGFDIKNTRFYHDIIEEGEALGIAKGEALGIAKGVLKLLQDRFGTVTPELQTKIMGADVETLLSYYEKIWNLQKPEDLFKA